MAAGADDADVGEVEGVLDAIELGFDVDVVGFDVDVVGFNVDVVGFAVVTTELDFEVGDALGLDFELEDEGGAVEGGAVE